MSPELVTCTLCGEQFIDLEPERAWRDARQRYGEITDDGMVTLCEACGQAFTAWEKEQLEKAVEP